MSYNCNIVIQSDENTLKILEKKLSDLKEANIEIFLDELIADFREDCSGLIYDLAKSKKLSFTMNYFDEDDNCSYSKYINGTEVISEDR